MIINIIKDKIFEINFYLCKMYNYMQEFDSIDVCLTF